MSYGSSTFSDSRFHWIRQSLSEADVTDGDWSEIEGSARRDKEWTEKLRVDGDAWVNIGYCVV